MKKTPHINSNIKTIASLMAIPLVGLLLIKSWHSVSEYDAHSIITAQPIGSYLLGIQDSPAKEAMSPPLSATRSAIQANRFSCCIRR